jgi:type IX secretion system PorP/SprF family membrane protein
MKLKIWPTFFLYLLINGIEAQQLTQWSSFYENGFIQNPALTARWNTWELSTTYKREWTGFDGGPEVGTIGFQYPFIRRFTRMTMGAYVSYDRVGPLNTINYALTYAYKIRTKWFGNRDDVLSFGLKGGLVNYRFDPTTLRPYDKPEGNNIVLTQQTTITPDIVGGIFYNSVSDFYSFKSHYFMGLALTNIMSSSINSLPNEFINTVPHVFIHGGYRYFPWRAKYYFEPSLFISYTYQRPFNAMASCRFEMLDKFWLNSGGSTNGEVFFQTGVIFDKKSILGSLVKDGLLRMGVKADYSLSSLRRYSGIGYEFYMAYLFSNEPY